MPRHEICYTYVPSKFFSDSEISQYPCEVNGVVYEITDENYAGQHGLYTVRSARMVLAPTKLHEAIVEYIKTKQQVELPRNRKLKLPNSMSRDTGFALSLSVTGDNVVTIPPNKNPEAYSTSTAESLSIIRMGAIVVARLCSKPPYVGSKEIITGTYNID